MDHIAILAMYPIVFKYSYNIKLANITKDNMLVELVWEDIN